MGKSNSPVREIFNPETAILGMIAVDNDVLDQVLDTLSRDDFTIPAHRIVFDSMCRVKGQGRDIAFVTIADDLEKSGELDRIGGQLALINLLSGIPPGPRLEVSETCRIIKDKSVVRTLVNNSKELIARCSIGKDHPATLIEFAQTQLYDLTQRQMMAGSGPRPISEIAVQAISDLRRAMGEGGVIGIPTGFPSLDDLTAGWQEGELTVLAARPSLGKSALALDFTRNLCQRGIPVGIFSLEMPAKSIFKRLACRVGKIDSSRAQFGKLTPEEGKALLEAAAEVSRWPLYIDESAGLHSEQLEWRIRSLAQRAKPRLVIVDHMQLLQAKAENRNQEMSRISGGLQRAARDLGKISNGSLLALSQLSRLAAGKEPQLQHLRESGAIEQDADVVMFLWDREKAKFGQQAPVQRVLKIGKQRNGPTGMVPLLFIPTRVGYEEGDLKPPGKARESLPDENPAQTPETIQ